MDWLRRHFDTIIHLGSRRMAWPTPSAGQVPSNSPRVMPHFRLTYLLQAQNSGFNRFYGHHNKGFIAFSFLSLWCRIRNFFSYCFSSLPTSIFIYIVKCITVGSRFIWGFIGFHYGFANNENFKMHLTAGTEALSSSLDYCSSLSGRKHASPSTN